MEQICQLVMIILKYRINTTVLLLRKAVRTGVRVIIGHGKNGRKLVERKTFGSNTKKNSEMDNLRFSISTEKKLITLHRETPIKDLRYLLESFSGEDWLDYTIINDTSRGILPDAHSERRVAGISKNPPTRDNVDRFWRRLDEKYGFTPEVGRGHGG